MMTTTAQSQEIHPSSTTLPPWAFAVLGLLIVQIGCVLVTNNDVLSGGLIDTDSYMRLNRVLELHQTGGWFNTTIPRSNAPYGEILHWTRPFDVLLLGGAGLLSPWMDFNDGLHWWGVCISPLLHLLTLFSLLWLAKPFWDRESLLIIASLSLLQPGIVSYFRFGRPDHHGLLLLCFMLSMGLLLRITTGPLRIGLCWGLGIVLGFSLWASVETIITFMLCYGVLAAMWVYRHDHKDRALLHISCGIALIVTLALIAEHPWPHLLEPEYDRISFPFWLLVISIGSFWAGTVMFGKWFSPMKSISGRVSWVLLGGVLIGYGMWATFPDFFRGPLADVDPEVKTLLWNNIAEIQPLIGADAMSFGKTLFLMGLALPAVPYLVSLIRKEQSSARRFFWLTVGLALLVYLPLALFQVRWSPYAEFLLVLPYSQLVKDFLRKDLFRCPTWSRAWVLGGATALMCVWPLVVGGSIIYAAEQSREEPVVQAGCPIDPLAEYLKDPEIWGKTSQTILAFVDFGPELLYRTPHRVLATPYHRNAGGFLTAYRIMSSTEEEKAHALLHSRRVDLILLCPASTEGSFYRAQSSKPTLHDRLLNDQGPDWVRKVALPQALADSFRLFQVKY